jgi:hypothetical protein
MFKKNSSEEASHWLESQLFSGLNVILARLSDCLSVGQMDVVEPT